jgi:hypothetical protein
MNKNTLLILGASMIVVGAILKITHTFDPWNHWIFRAGFVFGLIYLVLRSRKVSSSKK